MTSGSSFTRLVTVACAIFILLRPASAEVLGGRCVEVIDGDTIRVLTDHGLIEVRLKGIDAPELKQAFGPEARSALTAQVLDKIITVNLQGEDKYGRSLGLVMVSGRDASSQMLSQGYAWHYTEYSSDPALAALEKTAQAGRRGLWKERFPVPPWEFRETGRSAEENWTPPPSETEKLSALAATKQVAKDSEGKAEIKDLPVRSDNARRVADRITGEVSAEKARAETEEKAREAARRTEEMEQARSRTAEVLAAAEQTSKRVAETLNETRGSREQSGAANSPKGSAEATPTSPASSNTDPGRCPVAAFVLNTWLEGRGNASVSVRVFSYGCCAAGWVKLDYSYQTKNGNTFDGSVRSNWSLGQGAQSTELRLSIGYFENARLVSTRIASTGCTAVRSR